MARPKALCGLANPKAPEECPPGHVLVIDCRGDATGASGGMSPELMAQLRSDYQRLKTERWNGFSGYDGWFDSSEDSIVIGEELDQELLYHELLHAWASSTSWSSAPTSVRRRTPPAAERRSTRPDQPAAASCRRASKASVP